MVAAHKVLDEGILQGTVDIENLVTSGPFMLDSFQRKSYGRAERTRGTTGKGTPGLMG